MRATWLTYKQAEAMGGQVRKGEWVRRAGAPIRIVGGARVFYSPVTDAIQMPPVEAFKDEEAWAATLAHESIHFTGHASRLDRLTDYARDRKARAREELIAAMLGAMPGFRPDHMEDHAAYIGGLRCCTTSRARS